MATFYVSAQTGNDSDNGTTAALAKATVQAGSDLIDNAGDIVYIAPGTYRETVNFSSAVNGSQLDRIKLIGDPDCEQFPGEEKGIVRITATDANDFHSETAATLAVIYCNKQYVEIHNMYIDGAGHEGASGLTSLKNSYGLRAQFAGRGNAINCMSQNVVHAFYRMNTYNCVGMGGYSAFYQGDSHKNSIGVAGYTAFYLCGSTVDCIGMGGTVAGFWNCTRKYGCLTIGGSGGFRGTNGDFVDECISACNGTAINGSSQTAGMEVSGSYITMTTSGYRGEVSNTLWGPGIWRFASSTSNLPNSTGYTIGDNNTKLGKSVLWSYNNMLQLKEAFKPTILNDGLRGTTDNANDATRNAHQGSTMNFPAGALDRDILGHPRQMGLATASLHLDASKLSTRDIGPWEFSTIDYTGSYATGSPGVRIAGEGVQSFDIPVPSGSAFTASVDAKWISAHDTYKPSLSVQYSTLYPTSSTQTGDAGASYYTGSQLFIMSASSTAATNVWQTISVSASAVPIDQILQVQLYGRNTGSTNYAIFSDVEIL